VVEKFAIIRAKALFLFIHLFPGLKTGVIKARIIALRSVVKKELLFVEKNMSPLRGFDIKIYFPYNSIIPSGLIH